MIEIEKLVEIAKRARENAYTPYSNYKVGCALVTKNGRIYSGCNVENDGIMSICAERVAFVKAISEGEREFEALVVIGGKERLIYTSPCGYCRQFISEFCDKNFAIYMCDEQENIEKKTLEELLPNSFNL